MKVSAPATATSMASLIASTAALSISPSPKPKTEPHQHHASHNSLLRAQQQSASTPYDIASDEGIAITTFSKNEGDKEQSHRSSVMKPAPCDYEVNLEAWSQISSVVKSNDGLGLEIRVEWKPEDDIVQVARYVVGETNPWFVDGRNLKLYPAARLLNLVSSMKAYVDICESSLHDIEMYRLKLSAMYGDSATRCPLWHIDNVPIRWIQTMLGPGTSYVDDESKPNKYLHRVRYPDREMLTQQEQDIGSGRRHWKDVCVEESHAPIQQATEGEPIVLPGYRWSETSRQHHHPPQSVTNGNGYLPVIHRSPHDVPKDQGRILLNLDVICGDHKCDCC